MRSERHIGLWCSPSNKCRRPAAELDRVELAYATVSLHARSRAAEPPGSWLASPGEFQQELIESGSKIGFWYAV